MIMLLSRKKQTLILIITFISLQLFVNITCEQPTPYSIYGTIKNYNGELAGQGINVTVINERTAENKTVLTNIDSQYIVDLSTLSSGYSNGDSIKIVALKGEQIGIAYTSIDLDTGSSQADVILSKTEYLPYRIWGYVYFENYSLIEDIVIIKVTNLRTGNSINTTTSIFGKYQVDVSGIPDGYKNLDDFEIIATYKGWQGLANGTLNLGNTLKETKIDVYVQVGGVTDTITSFTTNSDHNTSSFEIFTILILLVAYTTVKSRNRKD